MLIERKVSGDYMDIRESQSRIDSIELFTFGAKLRDTLGSRLFERLEGLPSHTDISYISQGSGYMQTLFTACEKIKLERLLYAFLK